MPEMNITVRNKIATKTDNVAYVCGNSDYVINFAFDGEWDVYDTKTARFAYGGQHTDVVFTGNQCNVPVITNTYAFHVGVFAGDLHTTTAARVPCRKCILCGSGAPDDPPKNVYDQLMERMAQLETSDWAQNDPAAKDYVKNRTHYVSRESRAVVPEQEVTTAVQNNFNIAKLNDVDSDALEPLLSSDDDTTFDVVFDGASYQCKWLEQGGKRIPVFGNFAIVNPSVTDTGEPFVFSVESARDDTMIAIACKVAGTHTVAVSYQQDVVHTLDPKYIKDMYYSETLKKYVSGYTGFCLATGGSTQSLTIEKIRYDGAVYENVSGRQSMQYVYYDLGDVRVSVNMSSKTIYVAGDDVTETGIEFYTDVTVTHPVPDAYMPDWVAHTSSVFPIYYVDASKNEDSLNLTTLNVDRLYPCIVIAFVGARTKSNILSIMDEASYRELINCHTGARLTSDETPYSVQVMFCAEQTVAYGAVCLNPL